MRFEIRSGGIGVILVGLVALSTIVFVFGLWAGYEIGIQSQSSSAQMATAYPIEASPPVTDNVAAAETPAAAVSSPVGGNSPAAASSLAAMLPSPAASIAPSPAASVAAAAPVHPPGMPAAAPSASTGITNVKVAAPPAPAAEDLHPPVNGADVSASTSGGAGATPPDALHTASAEHAPAARRTPFNIQIQAAMDQKGADQMMGRLQQLGYQPHLVSTRIGGQTWYKVEVGPYASQDEAAAAEAELRLKYNSTFGGGGQPDSPADSSAETTE